MVMTFLENISILSRIFTLLFQFFLTMVIVSLTCALTSFVCILLIVFRVVLFPQLWVFRSKLFYSKLRTFFAA